MSSAVVEGSGINKNGSAIGDEDFSFVVGKLSEGGSANEDTLGRVSYSALKEDGTFDVLLTGHADRSLRENYILTAAELVAWFDNSSDIDYYLNNIKVKLS